MGRAAADFADFFIITTDDPLDQDPVEIAREVQTGAEGKAPGRDYEIVIDPRAADRGGGWGRGMGGGKPGRRSRSGSPFAERRTGHSRSTTWRPAQQDRVRGGG